MNVDVGAVRRAKEGNIESFEMVYAQVAPDLYRVALYTLGNTHDAEDAVSETFLEAFKGIKNLRDETKFASWIMKILSIRCKRKIGQYIKDKNSIDIDEIMGLTSTEGDPTQRAEVLTALNELKQEERLIVVLSVLQGYTIREIAAILGCPQGTVSSKFHRTLKKLKEKLS